MKNSNNKPLHDRYFALLDKAELLEELYHRRDDYYNYLKSSNRFYLWRNVYQRYYQQLSLGGNIYNSGDSGEFSNLSINQFRNIILTTRNLITQQPPSYECRAANSDTQSLKQTILANGILEYYQHTKHFDRFTTEAVEWCLLFGEAFVSTIWNPDAGENYAVDPETLKVKKEGDIELRLYNPIDVIRDFSIHSHDRQKWYITVDYVNKYELAEEHPNLKDDILSCPATSEAAKDLYLFKNEYIYKNDELIPYYTFYHKPTSAVPNGRTVEFLDNDVVLVDAVLPFSSIPVHRITAEEQLHTPFGYTIAFDLLPLQQGFDVLYSIIITNQSTFGVQNIMAPKGSGVDHTALATGMNLIEYNKDFGPPQPLNLTQTPQEIFQFTNQLEKQIEVISGINSVARGQPNENLKSGSALALVQSQAVQFVSHLQNAYVNLLEDIGTSIIYILQNFATTERVVTLIGDSNRNIEKSWNKSDIDKIHRVTVDLGNPLTNTTAGRLNLADSLLQHQMITDPQQYITVMNTGRLEPMIKGAQAENILILQENEELSEGRMVKAIATDDHKRHVLEHKGVLANVEVRDQHPDIIKNTLAHIQEHIELLQTTDPNLLQMLNEQPLQKPMPQMPQQATGNQGNPTPAPINPAVGLQAPNPLKPLEGGVPLPKMPQPAKVGHR